MAEENGLDSGIRSTNSPGSPARRLTSSADSSKKTVVPHYLRASTGSCHDMCKYGREHSFEKKERKPFRKKMPNEPSFVEILLSDKQKKEMPSTDAINHSPDRKPSKSYSPKPKSSLDKGKAMKHKPSKDTKDHSPDVPSAKSNISNVKTYSRKENGSSGNKNMLSKKPKMPSSTKTSPSADPPEIVKGVIFPSTQVEDSVKRATSTDKKLLKKTTYVSQPRFSPVKSNPVKVKPSTAYSNNSDCIGGKGIRNGSAKMGKKLTAVKAPLKKVPVAPVATVPPKLSVNKIARNNSGKAGNLKLVSSVKDRNKPQRVKTEESNDEKVAEKTLHVIETDNKNHVSESTPGGESISTLPSLSSAESSSFAESSSLSYHEDEHSGDEVDEIKTPPVTENHNKTLSKSRVVVSEDKCHKIKFRSRKVVDVQMDNNSSRRLWFRRGSVLGVQESKGETRRALKKAGAKNDTVGAEVSSGKVVLKHQDVQDKKVESSSFADSSSLSSHEDEHSGDEVDEVNAPPVTENHNKTLRKSRAVVSEDKCRKIKFRSGKVVDVQMDTNSPRRLRFRRGSVLGVQESKGETRRALKKAGAKDDTVGSEVSSEKVVLKHQDVQDKKDAQVLLNNVIEETASKLVQSRKSKVKALVGAFETVISLQEIK